jgi:histidinol phosphatase-like enzyme
MGSPISITLSESYLHFVKKLIVKSWKATGEVTYYRKYVDDIVIISDQNKVNEGSFTSYMNSTHKYLEFKLKEEENKKSTIYIHPYTETTTYN